MVIIRIFFDVQLIDLVVIDRSEYCDAILREHLC